MRSGSGSSKEAKQKIALEEDHSIKIMTGQALSVNKPKYFVTNVDCDSFIFSFEFPWIEPFNHEYT